MTTTNTMGHYIVILKEMCQLSIAFREQPLHSLRHACTAKHKQKTRVTGMH